MLPFVIVVRVGLVALENGKEKKSARRGGFGHSFLLMPSQDRIDSIEAPVIFKKKLPTAFAALQPTFFSCGYSSRG